MVESGENQLFIMSQVAQDVPPGVCGSRSTLKVMMLTQLPQSVVTGVTSRVTSSSFLYNIVPIHIKHVFTGVLTFSNKFSRE